MINAAQNAVDQVRDRRPDVYALAVAASVAPRITPDFLREVRLGLGGEIYKWLTSRGPIRSGHHPDADTEAALWFDPLIVRGHGPEGIVLRTDVASHLRLALQDSPFLERAREVLKTQRHLEALPPELQWQAQLSMLDLDSDVDMDKAVELEKEVLLALDDASPLARAVAHWLLREAHPAIPKLSRVPLALVAEIAAGSLAGLPPTLLARAPDTGLEKLWDFDLSDWKLPTRRIFVRRVGGTLEISERPEGATYVLDVPATNPLILRLSYSVGYRPEDSFVRLAPGGKLEFLDVGVEGVVIRDLFGQKFEVNVTEDPLPRLTPGEGGVLHLLASTPLVGRADALRDLQAWLERTNEPLRNLAGPTGRGRQRLSDELARSFVGAKFVGHVRDTREGLPGLLFKLAEFLGVAGAWNIPKGVAAVPSKMLIVLQGLSHADLARPDLMGLIDAVSVQQNVKLLLTSDAAISEAVHELPPLSQTDREKALEGIETSEDVRRRLAIASGGEPVLLNLMRIVVQELGTRKADEIAAAFGAADDTAAKVKRLVEALKHGRPNSYVEKLEPLIASPLIAAALDQLYETVDTPDEALRFLVNWCNQARDSRVREKILSVVDRNRWLPSESVLLLLERIGVWEPKPDRIGQWPFWAAIGNMLGQVLQRNDDETHSIQGEFDQRLRQPSLAWRPMQVLTMALPKSKRVAAEDEQAVELNRSLWTRATARRDAHLQAAWTLAKDVSTAVEAREALKHFENYGYWTRTRLVISLVQLSSDEKRRLGPLSTDEPICKFLTARSQTYFSCLMMLWAQSPQRRDFHLNTVFQLQEDFMRPESLAPRLQLPSSNMFTHGPDFLSPPVANEARLVVVVDDAVRQFLGGQAVSREFAVFADLLALEIEVGANTTDRPLRRYDIFQWVAAEALAVAGERALNVVTSWIRCLDEGVRWGLAQRFARVPNGVDKAGRRLPCLYDLIRPEAYWTTARLLASDVNEWVVRDTIAGVAQHWPAASQDEADKTGAVALAEPARNWLKANHHHGDDQLADVRRSIESLRAICEPFASRWNELDRAAGQ